MRVKWEPETSFIAALVVATFVGVGLLTAEAVSSGSFAYAYLITNTILAWVPFVLAVGLRQTLRTKRWSSWQALALSVAWLMFLPNSFYMVSDFIHLSEIGGDQMLIAAVAFTSFIFLGLLLGIVSVYLIHKEFLKRVSPRAAAGLVGLLLLISSFAIYVGRDLRWNTWDVFLNPWGLLFDLSERFIHPSQYGQMLAVVVPFFVLLCSFYAVVWYGIRAVHMPIAAAKSKSGA